MKIKTNSQQNESKIHLLDDSTINKIAAGEVVERPASVVKELIENAIDAGATSIEIEIMGGGVSFIRVTDNGSGMSRRDAGLAVQRHATSKIRAASDLVDVATLGFRGEALPTIASVSRFSLTTRQAGDYLGTRVDIIGGKEPLIDEVGAGIGTTVIVEDLFFNTPARKKFLKTNQTEAGRINDYIIKLSLARPDIAFRFINNNKFSLQTMGTGDLRQTIDSIYGTQVGEALLTIDLELDEISLHGYITKPSTIKSSRIWQTYIVNNRIIQNRAIAKAIDNAYRALVPKMGFPMVVLNISVPPRSIDVNVHPQKTEMKFEDESRIFKAVYRAVSEAVRPETIDYKSGRLTNIAAAVERPSISSVGDNVSPHIELTGWNEGQSVVDSAITAEDYGYDKAKSYSPWGQTVHETAKRFGKIYDRLNQKLDNEKTLSFSEAQAAINGNSHNIKTDSVTQSCHGITELKQEYNTGAGKATDDDALAQGMIPIGQIDLTYIVAQSVDTLYIIDQHAAHERILFDRFSAMADGIPSQQLLVHQVLSFDADESELIENNSELFHKLGFQLEPAGDKDFRLIEVPTDIDVNDAEAIIREILSSLGDLHQITPQEIRKACLTMTACKAAIKAGEELSLRQMQIILNELARTPFPYTCPHGRPTILKFSSHDLAKMFKRTGF